MATIPPGNPHALGNSENVLQSSVFRDISHSRSDPCPPSDLAVNSIVEPLMHKNRLQEHTQRASMALPIYHNVNEGLPHCPKFRSSVVVDGIIYTSPNTFLNRKAAEQDASKYAMDCILNKIQEEKCSLLHEDVSLCKSILHEFSVKTNQKMPVYTTSQPAGKHTYYKASTAFNGITYDGELSPSKRMAEQLAARAAINTLLGKLEWGKPLYEIIKSKAMKLSEITSQHTDVATEPQPSFVMLQQGYHEFKKPKIAETNTAESESETKLPMIFVPGQQQNRPPSTLEQPVTNNRKSKNKKMKKKRAMDLSGGGGGGGVACQSRMPSSNSFTQTSTAAGVAII